MKPAISVVIPTCNKLSQLQRTLEALRHQDLPPERWEVVIVDDGSTDGTAAWLREVGAEWAGRLRIVSPGVNVGRAAARNLGGRAAVGQWILFLDDDIVAPPGLLSAHMDLLAGRSGWGVIGLVRTSPELVDAPHFHYIDSRGAAKVRGDEVPARYLVTQNTSVPRDVFVMVGGFDEEFTAYGFEDMELGFRLEDLGGTRFMPLRDHVPVHVHHHDLEGWLAKKRECGHGPLQRMAARHPRRIAEMRLHWVMETAPDESASLPLRALRKLARGPLAAILKTLLLSWPVAGDHRPRAFPLYARLMDLLVLSAYCQGLSESAGNDETT